MCWSLAEVFSSFFSRFSYQTGYIGTELASEIKCTFPDKQVTLIEANKRLVKGSVPKVSAMAQKALEKLGVKVVLEERL